MIRDKRNRKHTTHGMHKPIHVMFESASLRKFSLSSNSLQLSALRLLGFASTQQDVCSYIDYNRE